MGSASLITSVHRTCIKHLENSILSAASPRMEATVSAIAWAVIRGWVGPVIRDSLEAGPHGLTRAW